MRDYRGFGKAARPMLPSIGIPTTAGTGSEAQSYAIISDAETHAKMACGDPEAAFRVAILDPALTVTQPRRVTAIAGYDALSHAVESLRHDEAHRRLGPLRARRLAAARARTTTRVLEAPDDVAARGAMLLGAHEAGIAIEQSMLGATHALREPADGALRHHHGVAIAVMLPHVVRWNGEVVGERYAELLRAVGRRPGDAGHGWRAAGRPARSAGARWRPARDARRARRLARRPAGARRRRGDAVDGHVQPAAVRRQRRLELYERAIDAGLHHGDQEVRFKELRVRLQEIRCVISAHRERRNPEHSNRKDQFMI